MLVSSGATVDITGGSENWTPLFYAAMAGQILITMIVILLICKLELIIMSSLPFDICMHTNRWTNYNIQLIIVLLLNKLECFI